MSEGPENIFNRDMMLSHKCAIVFSMGNIKHEYDKRILRLMGMLNDADQGTGISVHSCAERYNVTIRTIQRDVDLLCKAGFPLCTVSRSVYGFVDGFSLKKLQLTSEEASLLALFGDISSSLGKPFQKSFDSLRKKLITGLDNSPLFVKFPQAGVCADTCADLPLLKKAIQDHHYCEIHYRSATRDRDYTVKPLKIAYFDGFWYLLAYRSDSSIVRKFRLEKISHSRILSRRFVPPRNLDKILEECLNVMFNMHGATAVILRVSKEKAHYFQEKAYFPRQKIVSHNPDDSLTIQTTIANYNEITSIILSWLPHIRVVRPSAYAKQLRGMLGKYVRSILR